MPQVCVAYGCTNSSHSRNKEKNKEENITFHRFPLDAKQRALWVQALYRKDWKPSKTAVLCSKHFQESSMDRTSLVRVRLREGAKPEIFPSHPPYLQNRQPLKPEDLEEIMKLNEVSVELQKVKSNFEYTRKRLEGKVRSLQLKVRLLQQKNRRLKKKVANQQDIITELKKKSLITEESCSWKVFQKLHVIY